MKKLITLTFIITLTVFSAYSQNRVIPNKPYTTLNSSSGYITFNNLTTGFGLGETNQPFSKTYVGFNTIHGYQIDRSFSIAGGTGFYSYGDGVLIPLYLDLRYNFYIGTITVYAFGDGGFLINPNELNAETKLFVNAGPGVRYTVSKSFAINLSPGLLIQMGPSIRSSFINFKIGATFKPR